MKALNPLLHSQLGDGRDVGGRIRRLLCGGVMR